MFKAGNFFVHSLTITTPLVLDFLCSIIGLCDMNISWIFLTNDLLLTGSVINQLCRSTLRQNSEGSHLRQSV